MIVFQVAEKFLQTTAVPQLKILELIEKFGGLTILIFTIAKAFVVFFEHKLMMSELIQSFYQTEKSHKKVDEQDEKNFLNFFSKSAKAKFFNFSFSFL